MATFPTLFVSHGSPMHAIAPGRPGALWAQLGQRLGRPRAVLIASAHWDTGLPMLTTDAQPATIHDFGGFPAELLEIRYAAPGAPAVAQQALDLLHAAGLPASGNGQRGLDHGAWVPLRQMFAQADVAVVQLSVQTSLGAAHHLRLGRALAPLAHEGVLLIGSGHLTHNLGEWLVQARQRQLMPGDEPPQPYVAAFCAWVEQQLRNGADDQLVRWQDCAPQAARAHPTSEHFLPLLFAYGAAGVAPAVERIDAGVDGGVLAMDAYVFEQT